MRALTICQPYAELILLGEKRVENRRWETAYRGPLLIHAGKSRDWLDTYQPLPRKMEFGAIVGRCRVVDCVPWPWPGELNRMLARHVWMLKHPHCEGPYCWVLDEVERFVDPVPYRGAQGIFDIPLKVFPHGTPAVPAGPRCYKCGCTHFSPCAEGCWWVEKDLCSVCAGGGSPDA